MEPLFVDRNPRIVVIGHYPEYVDLANKLSAEYFAVPETIWCALSVEQQWTLNMLFLDREISQGSLFILSTNLDDVRSGSWLEREIAYLLSRGYVYHEESNTFTR
jgi:hypothetical protein